MHCEACLCVWRSSTKSQYLLQTFGGAQEAPLLARRASYELFSVEGKRAQDWTLESVHLSLLSLDLTPSVPLGTNLAIQPHPGARIIVSALPPDSPLISLFAGIDIIVETRTVGAITPS